VKLGHIFENTARLGQVGIHPEMTQWWGDVRMF